MDRKYRQRGYEDRDSRDKKREPRPDRPNEPRPKQELMGPRTPRMVGTVMRARCSSCGAVLAPGFDQNGQCPRCHFELHCCKQCVHFDTGKAVRMHAADSGAHCEERRKERLHVLRVSHDRREGYVARELCHQHAGRAGLRDARTTRAKPSKISSRSSFPGCSWSAESQPPCASQN